MICKGRRTWNGVVLIRLLAASVIFPGPAHAYLLRDDPEITAIFNEAGITGTFVLFDLDFDESWIHNKGRMDRRYTPASTFKILNSLIGLETGVVESPETFFKWDGVKRFAKPWNRDQTLDSAFKVSAVWVYQEIAREVGMERMNAYVKESKYGSGQVRGEVDTFWLEGGVTISANEQVRFLKRLYFNELPFRTQHQEQVKRMMIKQETRNYILRAKTGWALRDGRDLGWYVGYLEAHENVYFFALNMDMEETQAGMREALTLKILDRKGLLGPAPEGMRRLDGN